MTSFNLPNLLNFDLGLAIKIFQIFVALIFIFFSLLTMRQVSIMNRSVITSLGPEIKIAAYFQLAAGIVVFFLILLV